MTAGETGLGGRKAQVMREEVREWFRQAQEDISAVRTNLEAGEFNWACFIAQQVAEKALKGLYEEQHKKEPPHTHSLRMLVADAVPPGAEIPQEILRALAGLDRHYTISRYRSSLDGRAGRGIQRGGREGGA